MQKKATSVRKKLRRSSVYDGSETDSEFSCPEDHNDYATGYNEERHKIYVDDKGELFGTSCNICLQKIACKPKLNCILLSDSSPVHVCNGRIKYCYKHLVCRQCYLSKIISNAAEIRNELILICSNLFLISAASRFYIIRYNC